VSGFLLWPRFHWSIARVSARCRFSCLGFGVFKVETSVVDALSWSKMNVLLVLGSSLTSKCNDFLPDVRRANSHSRVVHLALDKLLISSNSDDQLLLSTQTGTLQFLPRLTELYH
jgi:hypothetical protein